MYSPWPTNEPVPDSVKSRAPLSRRKGLTLFPIGVAIRMDFGGGLKQQGQVGVRLPRLVLVSALQRPEQRGADPPRDGAVAELKR